MGVVRSDLVAPFLSSRVLRDCLVENYLWYLNISDLRWAEACRHILVQVEDWIELESLFRLHLEERRQAKLEKVCIRNHDLV